MTENIRDIIGFSLDLSAFVALTPKFDNVRHGKGFKALERLEKKYNEDGQRPQNTDFIGQIYRSFLDAVRDKQDVGRVITTRRHAIALAWCLNYQESEADNDVIIIKSEKHIRKALEIIEKYYCQVMLHPLLLAYLDSWPDPHEKYVEFMQRIAERKSFPHNLIKAVTHCAPWLLKREGHATLGVRFVANQEDISTACRVLYLPESFITLKYFSSLYLAYLEHILRKDISNLPLDEGIRYLNAHNDKSTTKKALARIICKYGADADGDVIESLRPFVYKELGDPDIGPWSYPSNTVPSHEAELLDKARNIFRQWLVRESIELFFEVLSKNIDPHGFKYRKAFWLAYTRNIDAFRIVVTDPIARSLQRNKKIWEIMGPRISVYRRVTDMEECAFLFKIRNKVFVEFGKTGNAGYIYNHGAPHAPNLARMSYEMAELKHVDLRNTTISDRSEEGRFIHINSESYYWQVKLDRWLFLKLNITKNKPYKI